MKKILFLSSALLMTMAGAHSADLVEGAITGGANTCTVDVLKVYENNAIANTIATWSLNQYECAPGTFLVVLGEDVSCQVCPKGSYCSGGTYTVESTDKGSTKCPEGYPNSRFGSNVVTACYRECGLENSNLSHASGVSGMDFYGSGSDMCTATACVMGYHLLKSTLTSVIGTQDGVARAYIDDKGVFQEPGISGRPAQGQDYYGISNKQTFAVDYGDRGMLAGWSRCSSNSGTGFWEGVSSPGDVTQLDYLIDETGKTGAMNCYCGLSSYTSPSGEVQFLSSKWVFYQDMGSVQSCSATCADGCADAMQYIALHSPFSVALIDSVGELQATCVANTINIDWNPNNGGDVTRSQCVYNDAIVLPDTPTKPGYTFTGWKLDSLVKTEVE